MRTSLRGSLAVKAAGIVCGFALLGAGCEGATHALGSGGHERNETRASPRDAEEGLLSGGERKPASDADICPGGTRLGGGSPGTPREDGACGVKRAAAKPDAGGKPETRAKHGRKDDPARTGAAEPSEKDRTRPQEVLKFVRWSHPTGLISAEVPADWTVEGAFGPATDLGQFKLECRSAGGRSLVTVAHNWLSFMEFTYGPYKPGHATIEAIVLPEFLKREGGGARLRVVYRSPNKQVVLRNPVTGLAIPCDAGTLGFMLEDRGGGFRAGTAYAETLYIASPGTPGLWRLRLFMAALAPADARSQETARQVLERAVQTLDLSDRFFSLWRQAHNQTMEAMRAYSASMDRVFTRYLTSAGRSGSRNRRDPLDGWASMMRGGRYAEDETTGEQYWISNERDYWYVNDRGEVAGNDTGDPPTYGENWRPLRPLGP